MLKSLVVIERAASKIAPGRAPLFIEAHLVKSLMLLGSEGPLGRVKLSKTLGLGEGTVRTLTRHLEKEELIESSKAGIVLTDSGKKLYSSLKSNMVSVMDIPQSSLAVGAINMAILVKNAARAIRSGLEQRDAAIMIGAMGATTLVFSNGRLKMPLVDEDVLKKAPTIYEHLISKLKPEENDVIIIGSANERRTAELGAIAATLATVKAAGAKRKPD